MDDESIFFMPLLFMRILGIHNLSLGGDTDDYMNPWVGRNEKSAAAQRRENDATNKFNYLKSQFDLALYENLMTTIGLARHAKSKSPLKILPTDVMDQVLEFAGISKPRLNGGVHVMAIRRKAKNNAIVPFAGWRQKKNAPDETQLDLADISLFKPGRKIVIPLTKPNMHLTGPCWRDLHKYVKGHANWDLQRIAATDQQKIEYKQRRKGRVYFINAIYTVPIMMRKKKSSVSADMASTGGGGGKRKSPPPPITFSPMAQKRASSALQAALQSAASDPDGNVESGVFQHALDAGYSKHFILGKVAEYLESIKDTKPPAKKTKVQKE